MLVLKNNRVFPEVVEILCGFSQNHQCVESRLENPYFLNKLQMWSWNLYQQRQLPSIINHTLSAVFQCLKKQPDPIVECTDVSKLFIVDNSVIATSDCCIEFQV